MLILLAALSFQVDAQPARLDRTTPDRTLPRATAVRAATPPAIDGRMDDPVWARATPITEFRQFEPSTGELARFRTEARVAYDAANFYAVVRMYDDDPSAIRTTLARRDVRAPTDQIKLMIDSYFDRRSGYSFAVNPGGVKRDYAIYNDRDEDESWDGVWDVATLVDDEGWTAEFRIPLSQLRYPSAEVQSFGFAVWRDIDRFKERVSWPFYDYEKAGLMSQLGELTGITGLAAPRRLELVPYAVTRNLTVTTEDGFGHDQRLAGGVDFKYRLTSNLTLDGTVNPDFGQVEADPSVLNLTAFETFFEERRPFFQEGVGLFQFRINCYVLRDCGTETLFYSRRIGRDPQLRQLYGDARSPTATTILGAAKLTGRLPSGTSVGLLNAVTQRENGPVALDRTIEPTTNYTVARVTQDVRGGETVLGAIGTWVHRTNDQWSEDLLRDDAVTGGFDLTHRFADRRYQIEARVAGSRVTGSAKAIAATQRSNVHLYQRPDDQLAFDPDRTSLDGSFQQVAFGKFGGGIFRFQTSYQRTTPGFESNDLGFLSRADLQSHATWVGLQFNRPTRVFRRAFLNVGQENQWTTAGLPLDRAVSTSAHMELAANWWVNAGVSATGLGTVHCDRCARGGPALRTDGGLYGWGGIQGDNRRRLSPSAWVNWSREDGGRSRRINLSPGLDIRVSPQATAFLGVSWTDNRNDRQWYDNLTDGQGGLHYTFAHLEQQTMALTGRLDLTMTPELTLQLYAQPFVTSGNYTDLRELATPRAERYQDRFKPYTAVDPAGFNLKEFRSNVVLRWEYLPGSTMYLVWQQGRSGFAPEKGTGSFRDDLSDLFQLHPDNTLLLKVSYWLNR